MKYILFFCLFFIPIFANADDLITDNIANDCGQTYYYHAEFEPITYNCPYGTFLPAGAISCAQCPNNHTCNGGTFTFDANQTQGLNDGDILVQNAIGSCSINFNQNFKAVFEPNIITLNWNDGTNITTTQCTFGETITIPNPPTRPGYKFGGWRVKRRN